MPVDDVLTRARTEWLPALLNGSAIYPHLQPIVSLSDGRTFGYESLLRGQVGDRELNGGEIVAAARAHGAIFTLDLVGRTVALEQGMPKLQGDEVLFVNFTPTAIYDPEICLRTTWAIACRHGLSMDRICFEVVETEQFPDLAARARPPRGIRDRPAQHLARHDALTGLSNRGAFNTSGDTLLKDLTGGESAAVLFVDLDRFKRVNDIHGHDIGDEVLCAAADELRRVLGPDALLARHAGDEFLAVFPAPNFAAAEARAAIAAAGSTAPLLEHRIAGAITASVGWAVAQADHPRPLAELISEADAMMYRHKRIGNRRASDTRLSRLRSA